MLRAVRAASCWPGYPLLKLTTGMEAARMATLEPPSGDSPAYRQLTSAHGHYMRLVGRTRPSAAISA